MPCILANTPTTSSPTMTVSPPLADGGLSSASNLRSGAVEGDWMGKFMHSPGSAETLTNSKSKRVRSEEHTSELQSQSNLVCRLLLEKKNRRYKSLDTLKVKIISVTFRRVIRTNHKKASKIWRHEDIQLGGCQS